MRPPLWPPLLVFFTNNISGDVLYIILPFTNTSLQTKRSPASLVGEEHQQGRVGAAGRF
jgi:hypothetical protein